MNSKQRDGYANHYGSDLVNNTDCTYCCAARYEPCFKREPYLFHKIKVRALHTHLNRVGMYNAYLARYCGVTNVSWSFDDFHRVVEMHEEGTKIMKCESCNQPIDDANLYFRVQRDEMPAFQARRRVVKNFHPLCVTNPARDLSPLQFQEWAAHVLLRLVEIHTHDSEAPTCSS